MKTEQLRYLINGKLISLQLINVKVIDKKGDTFIFSSKLVINDVIVGSANNKNGSIVVTDLSKNDRETLIQFAKMASISCEALIYDLMFGDL